MESLAAYGLFLAEALTLLLLAGLFLALVLRLVFGGRGGGAESPGGALRVTRLNGRYETMAATLRRATASPRQSRREARQRRKQRKKQLRAPGDERPRIFVLDFLGDLQASAVQSLRHEITAILVVATERDEVLLRLQSTGGQVHAYGLAAAQLERIKAGGLRLTIAVDAVAASGGYMMACVADHLVAAPFAVVGSIGVIAGLPNFRRLLEKHDVDYEQLTAGQWKRTLSLFGENTDEGRAKLQGELEETHALFAAHVVRHRPQLELEQVATGEHWLGTQALERQLVDELKTSDELLLERSREAELLAVRYARRRGLVDRVAKAARAALASTLG